MKRIERLELNKLSEESFGSKSAWQSYLKTPYYVKETHPTANGEMRSVKVAKWRTLEEVIALMKGKEVNGPEILSEGEIAVNPVESSQVQDGSGSSSEIKID